MARCCVPSSLDVEVPDTGNLAAAPVINAYAITDSAVGPIDANKNPIGLVTRWERLQVPYSGTGDLVITNLEKADIYEQISIFSALAVDGVTPDMILEPQG